MSNSILIVDDDARVRTSLSEALERDGWSVRTASSGEAALSAVAEGDPPIVLADVRMDGMSGLELLGLLKERSPGTDVIIMTAHEDLSTAGTAMRHGAVDFLVKPLELRALRRLLDRLREDRQIRSGPHAGSEASDTGRGVEDVTGHPAPELVGRHPRMIEVFKVVGQVTPSATTVLIRGESGTGKELVARWIHENSPRAAKRFVAVNCTALPEGVLESELFGHVKGAFTGATSDRRGRFAAASGGTLFLDEIGDTSTDFQAKLLRVLEDGTYHPVGAERSERTDARVLAATHRDLESLVDEGTFRRDLYYRLRVVEVDLPPLRERRDDIPLIVDHLLALAAERFGRPAPTVSEPAMAVLLEDEWPGNVRQLRNRLERAFLLATGGVIRHEHVEPLRSGGAMAGGASEEGEAGLRDREPGRLHSLDRAEAEHVAHVLRVTGGRKTRAAQILGISRPRLDRLIKKHDLDRLAPGRGG